MATVRWDGLDELKAALRNLPEDLAEDAKDIVLGAANAAKADMHYPRRTGDLARKLKVETVSSGQFGARAVVKNTSRLAHIFEHGSKARHYITVAGSRHVTGEMPATNVFIPAVIRRRREMYERLKAMLVRHGLRVSGEP